ncbi:hypothetical protein Trydic_g15511 [Trypoxylus dichotomus]
MSKNSTTTLLPWTAVKERITVAANVSISPVSRISNSAKSQQALPSSSKNRNKLKPIADIDVIYQVYHNSMLKGILRNQMC